MMVDDSGADTTGNDADAAVRRRRAYYRTADCCRLALGEAENLNTDAARWNQPRAGKSRHCRYLM
jgi:hypothetical protein